MFCFGLTLVKIPLCAPQLHVPDPDPLFQHWQPMRPHARWQRSDASSYSMGDSHRSQLVSVNSEAGTLSPPPNPIPRTGQARPRSFARQVADSSLGAPADTAGREADGLAYSEPQVATRDGHWSIGDVAGADDRLGERVGAGTGIPVDLGRAYKHDGLEGGAPFPVSTDPAVRAKIQRWYGQM